MKQTLKYVDNKSHATTNADYTLSSLQNKHTPAIIKTQHFKPSNPWFTPLIYQLELACHQLEQIWSHTHSSSVRLSLRSATNKYHAAKQKETTTLN